MIPGKFYHYYNIEVTILINGAYMYDFVSFELNKRFLHVEDLSRGMSDEVKKKVFVCSV